MNEVEINLIHFTFFIIFIICIVNIYFSLEYFRYCSQINKITLKELIESSKSKSYINTNFEFDSFSSSSYNDSFRFNKNYYSKNIDFSNFIKINKDEYIKKYDEIEDLGICKRIFSNYHISDLFYSSVFIELLDEILLDSQNLFDNNNYFFCLRGFL